MKARVVQVIAALMAWVYCWSLFHNLRRERVFCGYSDVMPQCSTGDTAPPPGWIVVVLGLASTVLIIAAIAAWMKLPPWPWLGVLAGVGVVSAQVLVEYALLKGVMSGANVGHALDAAMARPPWAVAFLLFLLPGALIVAGIMGIVAARRRRPPAVRPHGAAA